MASKESLMRAAQAWCKSTTEHKIMDPDLAEAFAEILDEYRDALIWCSGSADFGPGGQAEMGWNKICRTLINEPGCQQELDKQRKTKANKLKYLVVIAGGIGPDTWDREIEVEADNIKEAVTLIEEKMECGEAILSIEQME